ncbi:hypothetical protein AB9P05_24060 [Roseivirga sp. BDSF3-8]|uniref:hypothetical protein n=1 Tax=Roseivirga sp. BDSF3-8 TaxID=3241598 RepID=UPI00353219D0
MKNVLIGTVMLLLTVTGTAQSQDVMDKVAEATCECFTNQAPSIKSAEQLQMQIALCGIQAATPYAKQIRKQHDFNIENLDDETGMEKFFEMLALRMVSSCPAFLQYVGENLDQINEIAEEDDYAEGESTGGGVITGTFSGLESKQFNVLYIEDESGRQHKLLWQEFFENANQVEGPAAKKLEGSRVKVYYIERDIYEPRLGEYIPMKIMRKLEVL